MLMPFRTRSVEIKTAREIERMREVGRLAAETLLAVGELIRPGLTTEEIDTFVHEDTLAKGAIPAPLNYRGTAGQRFPKSVCTSVNEVVCHGIPGPYVLAMGDIVNVDVTHIFGGFHGDTSATFYVGTPSEKAKHVSEVARKCLQIGIEQVRPGGHLSDIGAAIEDFAESQRCSVVREFVGHGIGKKFHDEPQVKHYRTSGRGNRLKAGMTFTIEPMINIGGYEVEVLDDEWTAVTKDRSLSAQFEHTVLVTPSGCEILTARDRTLANSEIFPNYFGE